MSQFRLLRERRFAPLFWTQFLGAFNDNVFKNALVILITFHGDASNARDNTLMVVLAAGVFILPFFLFSATAGQLADKWEKSVLIRRIKVAEILIMLLAAMGFYLGSTPFLVAVLFLMGTQSTLFGPLKYGILPQHLSEAELTAGNGLIQMGTFVAILIGTVAGGVLIAIPGLGPSLISGAVVLVALSGWLASREIPRAAPDQSDLRLSWNVPRETWRIMGFAAENREVFLSVLGISWFWFLGATYLSLMPAYGRQVLAGDPHVVTLLLTLFSVGIGLGSLSCDRLSRGHVELGLVPVGAAGLLLFGLDLAAASLGRDGGKNLVDLWGFLELSGNWRVMLDLFGLSLSGGVYIVPLYAEVQSRSIPQHRARVIAALNVLNALFMVFSAAFSSALLALGLDIPQVLLAMAGLHLLFLAWLLWRMPVLRRRLVAWAGAVIPGFGRRDS